MPFIIAGVLYAILAASTLVVIAGVCLIRRQPPGRVVLAGVAGSAAGFAVGCVMATLVGVAIATLTVGVQIGATLIVVPICLGSALFGSFAGPAILRRSTRAAA